MNVQLSNSKRYDRKSIHKLITWCISFFVEFYNVLLRFDHYKINDTLDFWSKYCCVITIRCVFARPMHEIIWSMIDTMFKKNRSWNEFSNLRKHWFKDINVHGGFLDHLIETMTRNCRSFSYNIFSISSQYKHFSHQYSTYSVEMLQTSLRISSRVSYPIKIENIVCKDPFMKLLKTQISRKRKDITRSHVHFVWKWWHHHFRTESKWFDLLLKNVLKTCIGFVKLYHWILSPRNALVIIRWLNWEFHIENQMNDNGAL